MAALSDKAAAKFSVSADELRDVLECPVCLKVPRQPPVYQCDRGHCFCSACHSKLSNCPVCRIPLGKTRSLIFEKVLAKMPHSCKYTDHGCTVEHTRARLETHEKDCPYRVVSCVDLACQQQVCMADLMNHMLKDHEREDFVHTENNSYRSHFIVQSSDFTREIMWISDHIVLEDRHFFRECCRSKEGQWFVWVYMIGSRRECEDYIYTVKIISDDKEEELSYKGRCVPLDVSKEKLLSTGNCLIFPDSTAKRFWANQRIHYQVYVVNKRASKKMEKEGARASSRAYREMANQNSNPVTSPKQETKGEEAGDRRNQASASGSASAAAAAASAESPVASTSQNSDPDTSEASELSTHNKKTRKESKKTKDSDSGSSNAEEERETSC